MQRGATMSPCDSAHGGEMAVFIYAGGAINERLDEPWNISPMVAFICAHTLSNSNHWRKEQQRDSRTSGGAGQPLWPSIGPEYFILMGICKYAAHVNVRMCRAQCVWTLSLSIDGCKRFRAVSNVEIKSLSISWNICVSTVTVAGGGGCC